MNVRKQQFIALGNRLSGVPEVLTLGVRPNYLEYTRHERKLILNAKMILFPSINYAQFFMTIGKPIFPSLETYLYADEKFKQTTLFYLLGLAHPRTKFYYHLHYGEITEDFSFPFIGKLARRSAKGNGVFKINNMGELESYLKRTNVAYIQEFLPHERDLRVILINYEPILAYWRIRSPGDFRTNLAQGGKIDFDDIPIEGVQMAIRVAKQCRFDDVGVDLILSGGRWVVVEANMKYGRKGLKAKHMDLKEIIRQKLISGEIIRGRDNYPI